MNESHSANEIARRQNQFDTAMYAYKSALASKNRPLVFFSLLVVVTLDHDVGFLHLLPPEIIGIKFEERLIIGRNGKKIESENGVIPAGVITIDQINQNKNAIVNGTFRLT